MNIMKITYQKEVNDSPKLTIIAWAHAMLLCHCSTNPEQWIAAAFHASIKFIWNSRNSWLKIVYDYIYK